MAKEKAYLYEEMVFDDVRYAVDIYNKCKRKREKVKKGLIIAVIATICNICGSTVSLILANANVSDMQEIVATIGVILAVVAYIMGGGLLTTLKWSWKIAKCVWIVFIFPFDFFLGSFAFILAFMALFWFPAIFVFLNYRQVDLDYQSASNYIKYYKAKEQYRQSTITSNQSRSQTSKVNDQKVQTNLQSNRTYSNQSRVQSTNRAYASTSRGQTGGKGVTSSRVRINSDGSRSYI